MHHTHALVLHSLARSLTVTHRLTCVTVRHSLLRACRYKTGTSPTNCNCHADAAAVASRKGIGEHIRPPRPRRLLPRVRQTRVLSHPGALHEDRGKYSARSVFSSYSASLASSVSSVPSVPSASSATAVVGTKRGSGSSASSATAAKQPRVGTRFVPVLTNEQESLLAAFAEGEKWVGHLRVATFGRASEDNKKKNAKAPFTGSITSAQTGCGRASLDEFLICRRTKSSPERPGERSPLYITTAAHTRHCACVWGVCVCPCKKNKVA